MQVYDELELGGLNDRQIGGLSAFEDATGVSPGKHISNTPKQLVLYEALGAPVPKFAHVPLILGADKKRLSKRHGATSVMEYARQGYLPEAMTNFLALLGWSPGSGDQEVFTREQLLAAFDLDGISGGSAVFDSAKLDWFNQQHLWRLPPGDLAERVKPLLVAAGLWHEDYGMERHAWLFVVLELLKPRAKKLTDFVELGRYFFEDQPAYDPVAVVKHLRSEGMREHLEAVDVAFAALDDFDAQTAEASLRGVAGARGVKAASLIHALRVALTGRSAESGAVRGGGAARPASHQGADCPSDRPAFAAGGMSHDGVLSRFFKRFQVLATAPGSLCPATFARPICGTRIQVLRTCTV